MKSVKKILQCQNSIIRALSNGGCTLNELEHKACNPMASITWDEYIHALKDLLVNNRIIKSESGFRLSA